MYDDNDSEEMSEREFAHNSLPPKAQAHAHIARLGGDYCVKKCTLCNCAEGHCYHPWSSDTPHFNPLDSKTDIAKQISGIRKVDTSEGKYLFPSREPPLIPEYYAACHSPETSSIDMYNNDGGKKFMKQTGALKAATLYFAS
jgi:hypothetical protein